MPIDLFKARLEVLQGTSAICATCERYWEGKDRGLSTCTAYEPCGSPIAGDVFHLYRGAMKEFDLFCFACGSVSTHVLTVKGKQRAIGCCDEHLKLVQDLKPADGLPASVTIKSQYRETTSDIRPKKRGGVVRINNG